MKTTGKISLMALTALVVIGMSSFVVKNAEKNNAPEISGKNAEADEWSKVYTFVNDKICTAIEQSDEQNGKHVKLNYFSRCPSGYESVLATQGDAVKTGSFVYGKIEFYRGCSPKYICNFKVCVDKDIALVKTKDMKEYIAVKDWLQRKNTSKAVVKG